MYAIPEDDQIPYSSYEELVLSSAVTETYEGALCLLSSSQWRDNYLGVDLLRTLNKHAFPFLYSQLTNVHGYLLQCLDSLHRPLVENTLLFFQELCCEDREDQLCLYMSSILPPLLQHLANISRAYSRELHSCLESIARHIVCHETADVLCALSNCKTPTVAENAILYLDRLLSAPCLHDVLLRSKFRLFKTWTRVLETGQKSMVRLVYHMLKSLEARLGTERLIADIQAETLDDLHKRQLITLFLDKSAIKPKPVGTFKQFS